MARDYKGTSQKAEKQGNDCKPHDPPQRARSLPIILPAEQQVGKSCEQHS